MIILFLFTINYIIKHASEEKREAELDYRASFCGTLTISTVLFNASIQGHIPRRAQSHSGKSLLLTFDFPMPAIHRYSCLYIYLHPCSALFVRAACQIALAYFVVQQLAGPNYSGFFFFQTYRFQQWTLSKEVKKISSFYRACARITSDLLTVTGEVHVF